MIVEIGKCPFDLLILDIDGVMTDGNKYYGPDGRVVMKTFNDRDFTAIKRFKMKGVKVCFLSGDENINGIMAKNRGIDFFKSDTWDEGSNKELFIDQFQEKYKVTPDKMAYVGDDFYDIGILEKVGYPFCTDSAPDIVKSFVRYSSPSHYPILGEVHSDPFRYGYVQMLYDIIYSVRPFGAQ